MNYKYIKAYSIAKEVITVISLTLYLFLFEWKKCIAVPFLLTINFREY